MDFKKLGSPSRQAVIPGGQDTGAALEIGTNNAREVDLEAAGISVLYVDAAATKVGLKAGKNLVADAGSGGVDLSGMTGTLQLPAGGIVGATNAPTWTEYTVTFTQLSEAAATKTITLASLAAAGIIHGVKTKQSAAFTGGALSAFTVEVGIDGNLDKYSSAFDVFQAPGAAVMQVSGGNPQSESHTTATDIKITARSTGANTNAATAGSVDVWLLVSKAS